MNRTASCYAQPRPERHPPTQNAASYHVYRAHFQIVHWRTLLATDIQPTDWGWKISNDCYVRGFMRAVLIGYFRSIEFPA